MKNLIKAFFGGLQYSPANDPLLVEQRKLLDLDMRISDSIADREIDSQDGLFLLKRIGILRLAVQRAALPSFVR